ncbi:MAG: hypothetical protein OXF55_07660 [Caldilineaceae bacterium]|nr:hypothetical protein [Caldilineaceae bacterium]
MQLLAVIAIGRGGPARGDSALSAAAAAQGWLAPDRRRGQWPVDGWTRLPYEQTQAA